MAGRAHGRNAIVWEEAHEEAFVQSKAMMTSAPVLAPAIPGRPFMIYSDASDFATGAVLMQ